MLNKSAGLSPLILEIIGGVIVVAIILVLFAGFASPFLEFLSDQKNIEAFNKFTSSMSRACKEGTDTVTYWSLGHQSPIKIYAIGLISSDVTDELLNIGGKVSDHSKNVIKKCENTVCWCLFKITYSNGRCSRENLDGIYIKIDNLGGYKNTLRQEWDNPLANKLSSGSISKIDVFMCSTFEELNCATKLDSQNIPLLLKVNENNFLVWIQSPVASKGSAWGSFLDSYDLNLDSLSFDRPVAGSDFEKFVLFEPKPKLKLKKSDEYDYPGIEDLISSSNCPGWNR